MTELFAQPRIEMSRRADGSVLLRSTTPLDGYHGDLAAPLLRWAGLDPQATLAAEWDEPAGTWRHLTYQAALARASSVAEALLERGLGPQRPLVVLSGNSMNHLVLTLAGYLAGIPVAPLSPNHSLGGANLDRLRDIVATVGPGAVYTEDTDVYAAALAAVDGLTPLRLCGRVDQAGPRCVAMAELAAVRPGSRLELARAAVGAASVAKILFTSGSTGEPKGVPNTHGMLAAVQQMMRQAWPFLAATRLVLVDWLPWSHTFGGNHNLNMVLATGGTLHLDDGGPTAQLFPRSLARLRGLSPNVYFNVPAGFEALAGELERDRHLATGFFSRLRLLLSAGAPLSEPVRRRVLAVARDVGANEVRFTSSWGMTETSSAATSAHLDIDEPAAIGVPLPGIRLKLSPVDGLLELRVSGPTVLPGYLNSTVDGVFDEEGYFRTGDAARLVDSEDANRGLIFEGRIAEDFKLSTGTWVRVGPLRAGILAALDPLAEVVPAAPGRPYLAALAWLRAGETDTPALRERLRAGLAELGCGSGSSRQVRRLLLLAEPPNRDGGELSAKGTVNQRMVLRRRDADVTRLYQDPPPVEVIEVLGPGE